MQFFLISRINSKRFKIFLKTKFFEKLNMVVEKDRIVRAQFVQICIRSHFNSNPDNERNEKRGHEKISCSFIQSLGTFYKTS